MSNEVEQPQPIDPAIDVDPRATQVANPGRATTRTVVQNILGAIVGFGLLAPFLLQWLVDGLEQMGLTEQAAYVSTALGGTVVAAGLVARVMAMPGVESWLQTSAVFRWMAAAKENLDNGPGDMGFDANVTGYRAEDQLTDERVYSDDAESAEFIIEDDAELPEPVEQDTPKHREEKD